MPIQPERYSALSKLEFHAKQVVEGFLVGLHKSPFHGFSVEFAEHRSYNPGESTRHVDWKLYAKTDKLFVKKYDEETNLRCQLIIDASSSMHFPDFAIAAGSGKAPSAGPSGQQRGTGKTNEPLNKIEFSVHAAAALIQLLRKQRDAIGLSVFADKVLQHHQAKSNAVHQKLLMTELEALVAPDTQKRERQTFAVDALHQIAQQLHRRSLVVIFSDMIDNSERTDELFQAMQHLKFNKHEVILFHVVDKKLELELDLENRPYTFVDLETGAQVKADPTSIRDAYREGMSKRWQDLKVRCAQYHIDLVEADINAGFENIMLQFLVKRGKLY